MAPQFTGPRYGYHETNIVEQTGVKRLDQIEGTMEVFAHHIHNVEHKGGRLCYPLSWSVYSTALSTALDVMLEISTAMKFILATMIMCVQYGNDKRFIIRGIQRTRMSAIAILRPQSSVWLVASRNPVPPKRPPSMCSPSTPSDTGPSFATCNPTLHVGKVNGETTPGDF